jgi:hypothetical protein
MFTKLAIAFVFAVGILCSAYAAEQVSLTAKSGEPKGCHHLAGRCKGQELARQSPVHVTAYQRNGQDASCRTGDDVEKRRNQNRAGHAGDLSIQEGLCRTR